MPQNCLGLYFNISGNYYANYFFPVVHAYLNDLNAVSDYILCLPYVLLALIYNYFATLHSAVNHGAICLLHLLGLAAYLTYIYLTTPALLASDIKNYSTLFDLS